MFKRLNAALKQSTQTTPAPASTSIAISPTSSSTKEEKYSFQESEISKEALDAREKDLMKDFQKSGCDKLGLFALSIAFGIANRGVSPAEEEYQMLANKCKNINNELSALKTAQAKIR